MTISKPFLIAKYEVTQDRVASPRGAGSPGSDADAQTRRRRLQTLLDPADGAAPRRRTGLRAPRVLDGGWPPVIHTYDSPLEKVLASLLE
ncbi:MAG: hypothetical protein AB1486_28085 [Planctomycetota bacterium]